MSNFSLPFGDEVTFPAKIRNRQMSETSGGHRYCVIRVKVKGQAFTVRLYIPGPWKRTDWCEKGTKVTVTGKLVVEDRFGKMTVKDPVLKKR